MRDPWTAYSSLYQLVDRAAWARPAGLRGRYESWRKASNLDFLILDGMKYRVALLESIDHIFMDLGR